MGRTPEFLTELSWRGLVQDASDGLRERLARAPIAAYVGFDASARSLHVGNLMQVFLLTHLQRSGGRPVILIGGATGMIGDPSGKSSERNLLDDATIEINSAAIRGQLERFIEFGGGSGGALLVDNRDWLRHWGLLEFLRDVGKHFPLSYMLAKESVQLRMAQGISFTEFSYMTLQGADFLHLRREHGVEMQMGGADQWGNITAGLELIRRIEGREEGAEPAAYGLCSPLLLTRTGQKMGKSEKGAVFLDAHLTSPYDFFQYWLNDDDTLVGRHLRWFTFLDPAAIGELEREQAARPEERPAHRALAFELTALVHGREEAQRQRAVAGAAFAGGPIDDPIVLEALYENVGGFELDGSTGVAPNALDVALASGLFSSRSDARRQISQGALTINGQRIGDLGAAVPEPIGGRYLLVRAGRKRLAVGRVSTGS